MLTGINEFQDELHNWREKQPWRNESREATCLGLAEEAGEVCRAVLKREQKIRGTDEEWEAEIAKELGDVFVKLADVANSYGLSLEKCINERWAIISQRNFTRDRLGHGIDKEA